LVLLGLTALGRLRLQERWRQLDARLGLLGEFRQHYSAYIDSKGQNGQAFAELMNRVERMQRDAGTAAIYASFRPAWSDHAYINYEVFSNALPALRVRLENPGWQVDETSVRQYVNIIDDSLNRYAGRLQGSVAQIEKDARNPLVWFREGVGALLLAPAFILRSLGALPARRSAPVTTNWPLRILSAIVSVILFVSTVVTILSGWEATLRQLKDWGIRLP
jgi:hypothetical protein